MGVVYLADGPLGLVAIKVIRSEFASSPDFRNRFVREIQACFRVSSDHTARLKDFNLSSEPLWLATEYVDAPDLERLVQTSGPLGAQAQISLAFGMAAALNRSACGRHRPSGSEAVQCALPTLGPKVIDFGIAADAAVNGQSQIAGTPAWMAPERVQSISRRTSKGDVFSWGAILGYASTGKPLYEGENAFHLLYQVGSYVAERGL